MQAQNGHSCIIATFEGGHESHLPLSQGAVWSPPGYPLVWKEEWLEGEYIHVLLAISKWPGLGDNLFPIISSPAFTTVELLAPKGVDSFWET